MESPLFYIEDINGVTTSITLDEETSRHVVSVLRMKVGASLNLTDGKGSLLQCEITDDHKKKCTVRVLDKKYESRTGPETIIAMSLLKNASRFEWFLEKATEIGISGIIPLVCYRTEKQHFRYDRMRNILVSAMLQSQQLWLPELHQPIGVEQLLRLEDIIRVSQKFIAHCLPDLKAALAGAVDASLPSRIILIGPEGDFTEEEVKFATEHHFIPVSLGNNRLRTETAGVVAAVLLSIEN